MAAAISALAVAAAAAPPEPQAAGRKASMAPAVPGHSRPDDGPPPLAPGQFNPDPGVAPGRPTGEAEAVVRWSVQRRDSGGVADRGPQAFDPDSGAWARSMPATGDHFFATEPGEDFGRVRTPQVRGVTPADSGRLESVEWESGPEGETTAGAAGGIPVPPGLELPREGTRSNLRIDARWRVEPYAASRRGEGVPPHAEPVPDRWRVPFTPWTRYPGSSGDSPYLPNPAVGWLPWQRPAAATDARFGTNTAAAMLWHPYRPSLLKGDRPVAGQDVFLNLTAQSQTEFEARRLPVPDVPGPATGQGGQWFVQQYFGLTADLFRGETVFRPVDWAIRVQPMYDLGYVTTSDPGTALSGSPRSRDHDHFTLQQWFAEARIADLSETYDFLALRAGSQRFNGDFRGFVFNDVNLGARLFGNLDNNLWQYNLAAFDPREKDTFSDLNTFDSRGQRILVANAYRQDFLVDGYVAGLGVLANFDEGDAHRDRSGRLVRPAPLPGGVDHGLTAYYLGWFGDGHLGRLNVTHAFYQALGHDSHNALAGRAVDIDARFAALELSVDRDWVRWRAAFLHASGDHEPGDGQGSGFDAILDNPSFAGAPFSYFARQGLGLPGTPLGLKGRNSFLPALRTGKLEGQSNFVNPGLWLVGVGVDLDLTPKWRTSLAANYLRFAATEPLTELLRRPVHEEIGFDLSAGMRYRPFLSENVVIAAGLGVLLPSEGIRDIYGRAGGELLYSGLLSLTFTY